VSKRPRPPRHRRRDGLIPCPKRTAAPAPWTPRCTFVPISAVTTAVGWGWTICGRMVIPVAAPGASSTARRVAYLLAAD